MTSLRAIAGSPLCYGLCVLSIALLLAQMLVFLRAVRLGRGRRRILLAAANLLLATGLFVLMMDFSMSLVYAPEDYRRLQPFQLALFELPWVSVAALEAADALLLCGHILWDGRFQNSNLTFDAVRQTIDLLPEGLSITDAEGTVRLSNLKMNALCRAITGKALADGNRFFACVRERGEEQNGQYYVKTASQGGEEQNGQYYVKTASQGGEVWLFTRRELSVSGKAYTQLTATNVTERYRIIEELKAKNAHLQDLQRRMKAVSDLSADLFVAQEEANARAALHNQLGQVLLMGRYYLEHPESTDAEVVLLATREMNQFLLGESTEAEGGTEDAVGRAVSMARSIGVFAEIRGEVPKEGGFRELLALALLECAANTVKHAGGDYLLAELSREGGKTRMGFTNNGRPPRGVIAESGGLLALRRKVEERGGEMEIESQPEFLLVIRI